MFVLCDKYKLNFRIKRYIPNDLRKLNYLIAQKLLDESYVSQMLGKPWTNTFWAGQNISNLRESIQDIAVRGELQKIRNVNPLIEESVLNLLRDSRKQRRNYELSR